MGDLISRKALMRKLFFAEDGRKYPTRDIDNFPVTVNLEDLRKIIRNEPTAYDVDKVVERLIKHWCKDCRKQEMCKDCHIKEFVLDIVKGAVKDD